MTTKEQNNTFSGVPDTSQDPLARWAQEFLIKSMNTPEHLGITIRVTKKQGRYYVTEWRVGKQSFRGKPEDTPIARISLIRSKKGQWQLAWMKRDLKWHNLDETYQGSFEYCLKLIIKDPDCCFWG